MSGMSLEEEAEALTVLLQGRKVKECFRHDANEFVIRFDDDSTLFVNGKSCLEFSVTGVE